MPDDELVNGDEIALAGSLLAGVTELASIVPIEALQYVRAICIFNAYRKTHKPGGPINVGKLGGGIRGIDGSRRELYFARRYALDPEEAIGLARQIRQKFTMGVIAGKIERHLPGLRNGDPDALGQITSAIAKSNRTSSGDDDHHVDSLLKKYNDRIFEGRRGIETGLGSFDEYCGGLVGGDLVVFGARPKRGKSSIVATIVALIAVPTIIFSLEMTALEMLRKLICIIGKIPGRD
jgi:hypothetical protein